MALYRLLGALHQPHEADPLLVWTTNSTDII